MNDTIKITDDTNGDEKKAILARIDNLIRKRVKKPTTHELFEQELRREADDIVFEHNMSADTFLKVGTDIAIDNEGKTCLVLCCGQLHIEGAMNYLEDNNLIQGRL